MTCSNLSAHSELLSIDADLLSPRGHRKSKDNFRIFQEPSRLLAQDTLHIIPDISVCVLGLWGIHLTLLFDFWLTLTSISVRNKVCNARSMIATNPTTNASLWLVRSNIHGRRERRREGRSGELRECRTYGNSSTILFCTSSSIYPLKRKLSFYHC